MVPSSRLIISISLPTRQPVKTEVDKHFASITISDDSKVLKFWMNEQDKYLTLAQLAIHNLPIPASSAPVERVFSIAGKIFKPDRCTLSANRFEQLMFLRCSKNF